MNWQRFRREPIAFHCSQCPGEISQTPGQWAEGGLVLNPSPLMRGTCIGLILSSERCLSHFQYSSRNCSNHLKIRRKAHISSRSSFPISHRFRWDIGKVGPKGPSNDAFAHFNIRPRFYVNNSGQTRSMGIMSHHQTQYPILLDGELHC